MSDLSRVLDAIDEAIRPVCAHCDGPLGDSPSDDYCGPVCQESWHALRTAALEGYRDPLLTWATFGPGPEHFNDSPIQQEFNEVLDRCARQVGWVDTADGSPGPFFVELVPADTEVTAVQGGPWTFSLRHGTTEYRT